MKETDLFQPIKDLLIKNNCKVCGEIENCDIAAMKDDQLIIVELKTGLTLELILQAVKRQRLSDDVYIGIPRLKIMNQKKWKDYLLLIKRLGLGLIVVNFVGSPYAEIVVEPSLFDISKSQKQNKTKRRKLLKEFNGRSLDDNVGGSTGQKIMTAYKEQSLYIACCLYLFGPLSPKQLKIYGSHQGKTSSILTKNFNKWFYRIRTGLYDLTKEGHQAISDYKELCNLHFNRIKELKDS